MKRFGTDFGHHDSLASSEAWVDRMLVEIETHLPRMRRQCGAREFWRWFQGEAESAQRDLQSEEARRSVRRRLDALFKRQRDECVTATACAALDNTH
jgi:hypothetical protein